MKHSARVVQRQLAAQSTHAGERDCRGRGHRTPRTKPVARLPVLLEPVPVGPREMEPEPVRAMRLQKLPELLWCGENEVRRAVPKTEALQGTAPLRVALIGYDEIDTLALEL